MSGREISAAMHAAYVLNTYDRRVFVPADPPPSAEPAKTEKPEAEVGQPRGAPYAIVDSVFQPG